MMRISVQCYCIFNPRWDRLPSMKVQAFLLFTLFVLFIVIAPVQSGAWTLFALLDSDGTQGADEETFTVNNEHHIQYLPPLENKNIFEAIIDMSICRHKEVRKFIYDYRTSGKEFVIRGIKRSHLYMDIIDDVFSRYEDIPAELRLLPLLESGFSPNAVSRSSAVGLWQFMYRTSQALGIRVDNWIDERRTIHRSTEAALQHLRYLYRTFGSWELALAAYNGGARHVQEAIRKTGSRDFWELMRAGALRKETSEYVPRYAALAVIYMNQDLFELCDEIEPVRTFETELMEFRYPVDIRRVAHISGTPLKILRLYNPGIKRNYTPPDSAPYQLRVPAEAKGTLEENADKLYTLRFKHVKKYIVRRGDTLSRIARRYHIPTSNIVLFNDLRNPNRLRCGQVLYLPI